MIKQKSWLAGLGIALLVGLFLVAKPIKTEAQTIQRDLGSEVSADLPSSGLTKFSKDILTSFLMSIYGELSGTEFVENKNTGEYSMIMHDDRGALYALNKGIVALYDMPVSGTNYIAGSLTDLGLDIAPSVKAQGYGFYALDAIQDIWRIFRNVAYVFLTIIILVVGFMILFQQKLDGQLVLTVQKALPNIIIAMVLVTFSYAIAGLLIDAMYLLMYLFGGLFPWKSGKMADLMGDSIWGLGFKMIGGGAESVADITGAAMFGHMSDVWDRVKGHNNAILKAGDFVVWLVWDVIILGALGTLLGLLVGLVIIIVMIVAVFKLFFKLIKYYAIIIFDVIFAPVLLMIGAIPNVGFSRWFKSIIGNLSAFVTIFVVMTVYYVIVALANGETTIGQSQPLVGTAEAASGYFFAPPFAVGVPQHEQPKLALSILGLGILLVLPDLVERVRKKLGGESGFLGEFAGMAIGRVAEGAKGAAGTIGGKTAGGLMGAAGALTVAPLAKGVAGGVKGAWKGTGFRTGFKEAARGNFTDNEGKVSLRGALGNAITQGSIRGDQVTSAIKSVASGTAGKDASRYVSNTVNYQMTGATDYKSFVANADAVISMYDPGSTRRKQAEFWKAAYPNETVWATAGMPAFTLNVGELVKAGKILPRK